MTRIGATRPAAAALLAAACAPARTSPAAATTASATTTGATTPIVIGESFTMPARAIGGETRRINVWQPPRAAGDIARLPVLYMPDERHSTIFHPAATRAFRVVLAPAR